MNVLASLDPALPRVGQCCLRRSLSSSLPHAMPRYTPTVGRTLGLPPRGHAEPKTPKLSARASRGKEATATAKAGAGTAPSAWFIPKASSTAPVVRPSFLPPPPQTMHSAEDEVPPPPSSFPEHLHGLWTHLYTHPLIRTDAVQFISTARPAPRTIPILTHPPRNGKRNRGFADSGAGIGGLDIGGWWDWQVVCVVQGRGPGDVRRGELSIREWLSLNPLTHNGNVSDVRVKVARPVKGEPPQEWAQIDTGVGIAINVMTADAAEQYDLAGIWADPL